MRHLQVLACALFIGCCPRPVPTPSADALWDAGTETDPIDSEDAIKRDDCAKACANMRSPALNCPEADPVDGGDSCEIVCRHTVVSGLTDLKPKCVAVAKTVDEVRACGSVKCKR